MGAILFYFVPFLAVVSAFSTCQALVGISEVNLTESAAFS